MLSSRSRLAALVGAAAVAAAAAVPAAAQDAATDVASTATVVDVPDLPTDAAGNAKAILAYDGGQVPAGSLDLLDELGVVRGLELPSIGAVAVTAPQAVVEAVAAADPAVVAVEPQRALQLDLYASKEQINRDLHGHHRQRLWRGGTPRRDR